MRTTTIAGATALAALTTAAVTLPDSRAQQDPPASERIELRMAYKEVRGSFVDTPPKATRKQPSESPGDYSVSRGVLRTPSGDRAGTLHSIFTITGGKTPRTTELSSGTLVLRGGQITGEGVVFNRPGSKGPDVDVLAVTGATGRYAGMTGTLRATTKRSGVVFVLRLTR